MTRTTLQHTGHHESSGSRTIHSDDPCGMKAKVKVDGVSCHMFFIQHRAILNSDILVTNHPLNQLLSKATCSEFVLDACF